VKKRGGNVSEEKKSYTKKDDFVTRCITDETIIVPIRSGVGDLNSIYTLNEMGTRIWELMNDQTDIDKMAEIISSEYEVSMEEAKKDIAEFLSSLESVGLIDKSEPPEGT
jgi:hypothetical protein